LSAINLNRTEKGVADAHSMIDSLASSLPDRVRDEVAKITPESKPVKASDVIGLQSAIDDAVTLAVADLPKPDVKNVTALEKWFDPAKRYLAPVTYWWADFHWNTNSNWNIVFDNIDLIPFILINPHSGVGNNVEPDFVTLTKRITSLGRPVCAYVRTVTDLGTRTMRPVEDIKAELLKYKEFYGDTITGVFFDEAPNGWAEPAKSQVTIYKELGAWAKSQFGADFLVVMNPGSPTTADMLECADVLMTFEQSPENYLSGESNITPDWYKDQPSYRFWHAVHNVTDEAQAKQVLDKASKSNVAHVYLTTDKFSGVIGSESPDNNPWDNLPEKWLVDLQTNWCRRVSCETPQAVPNITIVSSEAEATSLPVGTIYAIVAPAKPEIVSTFTRSVNTTNVTLDLPGATVGDKVIIFTNTKGVSDLVINGPEGFTAPVSAYWAGTQRSWVWVGDYSNDLTITANAEAEYGIVALAVRNVTNVTVGEVWPRNNKAENSTKIEAPKVEYLADDLVLGVAFERTSATETVDQLTLAPGWERVAYQGQDANYQTVFVAKGEGVFNVTYPNSQQANGIGVQVVCHA